MAVGEGSILSFPAAVGATSDLGRQHFAFCLGLCGYMAELHCSRVVVGYCKAVPLQCGGTQNGLAQPDCCCQAGVTQKLAG